MSGLLGPQKTQGDLMPDFRAELGQRLRREARRAESRRRGLQRTRLLAAALAVLAVVSVGALAFTGQSRDATTAYALPILSTPTVDVADRFRNGFSAQMVLGPNAKLDRAHEIPYFGLKAYVVSGESGACLSVPDFASRDPQNEPGVTCARTDDLNRFGISLSVGPNYLAAIPEGVRDPALRSRTPAGAVRLTELHPSEIGTVAVQGLSNGDVIYRYDRDGNRRADRVSVR